MQFFKRFFPATKKTKLEERQQIVDEFDALWKNLRTSLDRFVDSGVEADPSEDGIDDPDLAKSIHLFSINSSMPAIVDKLRDEDMTLSGWDMGDCLEHALKNGYFSELVGYAKAVGFTLENIE